MIILYAPDILHQCPECHHTSIYFFEDVIMCILCGWERKRYEGPGPCAQPRTAVLGFQMPKVRRPSKRARQRARKAAMAKKAAEG